ncbi:MAG TPA: helix-turn-helix transcriptional regulator, partial [Firmicutes bacterium]|nr:helix-turn-helix transcriptional regulator [Bacillota bacterium]
GLKQIDVANMLGVSRTTYTQYETEKSEPDLATVAKLAEFFNTTTDYLLGNSNNPHPPDPDIKDAPIAFSGDMSNIDTQALETIIRRAVKKALDEREKEKK